MITVDVGSAVIGGTFDLAQPGVPWMVGRAVISLLFI